MQCDNVTTKDLMGLLNICSGRLDELDEEKAQVRYRMAQINAELSRRGRDGTTDNGKEWRGLAAR